ncbi:MAG: hypothetical protein EBZ77_06835 [Chitinophagia bacterium]|nr:hypothetical protein [Chitinophagia bacterium]
MAFCWFEAGKLIKYRRVMIISYRITLPKVGSSRFVSLLLDNGSVFLEVRGPGKPSLPIAAALQYYFFTFGSI